MFFHSWIALSYLSPMILHLWMYQSLFIHLLKDILAASSLGADYEQSYYKRLHADLVDMSFQVSCVNT